ncbi:YcxB family protein [Clostridium botulinum]|uniref:YcxB family protein n=2 Tax=Clostridium botulinum TaxID=1491 RepID=UPI000932FFC3|nr:YcxB family protein [Clostridium botulinum]
MYKFDNELKKAYCNDKKIYLFDPITLEVKDEGIMLNTSMNDELIKWEGIKDFNIIDGNIFIRTFTKDNVFIPSSVIKSEEDLNLLKEVFIKYGQIKPKNNYPKDIQFIIKK